MKKLLSALAGLALLLSASPAMTANVDVNVNIGLPGFVAPAPVYVEPRRAVVVQPAPVYVAPRPYYEEHRHGHGHGHGHGRNEEWHEHHDHGRHKGHGHRDD